VFLHKAYVESHLRGLLSKQRKHLDEIKKATNYDSTKKLIERYDESPTSSPSTPSRATRSNTNSPNGGTPSKPPKAPVHPLINQIPQTPRAPGHLSGISGTPSREFISTPSLNPESTPLDLASLQPLLPTPEKRWYDRLLDGLLGEDPTQASQSKYALVCGECFRHNGLLPKDEWEKTRESCYVH
jgi:endoplasmic reticulum junction formation protein lunapark